MFFSAICACVGFESEIDCLNCAGSMLAFLLSVGIEINPCPAQTCTKSKFISHITVHLPPSSGADALLVSRIAGITCRQSWCCLESESTAQSRFHHDCPCGHHDWNNWCFSESILPLLMFSVEIVFSLQQIQRNQWSLVTYFHEHCLALQWLIFMLLPEIHNVTEPSRGNLQHVTLELHSIHSSVSGITISKNNCIIVSFNRTCR